MEGQPWDPTASISVIQGVVVGVKIIGESWKVL